jgi:hypothetical protein
VFFLPFLPSKEGNLGTPTDCARQTYLVNLEQDRLWCKKSSAIRQGIESWGPGLQAGLTVAGGHRPNLGLPA